MKAIIEDTLKKVKMNEMSFLGVLAEDTNVCYVAQLQKLQTDNGSEKTLIVLIGITIIKNKNIWVDRYTVYKGQDTAASLVSPLKGTIAALSAANK